MLKLCDGANGLTVDVLSLGFAVERVGVTESLEWLDRYRDAAEWVMEAYLTELIGPLARLLTIYKEMLAPSLLLCSAHLEMGPKMVNHVH